jgi:hypothetical protein
LIGKESLPLASILEKSLHRIKLRQKEGRGGEEEEGGILASKLGVSKKNKKNKKTKVINTPIKHPRKTKHLHLPN